MMRLVMVYRIQDLRPRIENQSIEQTIHYSTQLQAVTLG